MKLFGKRTDQKETVKTDAPVMPVSENSFKQASHKKLRRLLPILITTVLFVVVIGFLSFVLLGPDSLAWKVRLGLGNATAFTVEGEKITNKYLYDMQRAYQVSMTDANGKRIGSQKDALVEARDGIILNRALKAEGKKHNLKVTEQDIDTLLAAGYKTDGGKSSFYQIASLLGRTREYILLINENIFLQEKLSETVLANTSISQMSIRYDYHDENYKNEAELAAYVKRAEEKLTKVYQPLLEKKVSTEVLARSAELSNLVDAEKNDILRDAFVANRDLLLVNYREFKPYIPGKTYTNFTDPLTAKDALTVDSQIATLKKPGEYTKAFKTQSGFVAMYRLEGGKENSYADWETFLKKYKESKKLSFIELPNIDTKKVFNKLEEAVLPKASALCAGAAPSHIMTVQATIRDQYGSNVPGVTVNHDNLGRDCDDASYGPSNGAGRLDFIMDCRYGPHHLTLSVPAGYTVNYNASNWNGGGLTVSNTSGVGHGGVDGVSAFHPRVEPGDNGATFGGVVITIQRVKPPTSTVQIHVFKARTDSPGSYAAVAGATTEGNCGNANSGMTTDGAGFATAVMNNGDGLCLRITSAAPAVGAFETITGPFIRPWGEGYGPGCGDYQFNGNYTQHCGNTTYECQKVGMLDTTTCGNSNVDRSSDTGFDFVYVITPAPAPSCTISASRNPMNEGDTTTISWSSTDSSSMIVTGNGNTWSGGSGSQNDTPTSIVTYTGTASNSSGSANCSTTVVVVPLPSCNISVTPANYVGGGTNNANVNWSSANASSMRVDRFPGPAFFASGLNGSQADNQQSPDTYTYQGTATVLNVEGITISRSCSATLRVDPPPGCSASPSLAAPNDPVVFTATGGDGSYTWSDGSTASTLNATYPTAGVYIVTVTSGGVTRSCQVIIANKPYHRVFGGDTLAGVGFSASDSSCPAAAIVNNKRQLGFIRNVGGNFTGGGNSHANIATGSIVDFVSGMLEPGPSDPAAFAFANTGGGYGGNFSTANLAAACSTNYYGRMGTTTPITSPANVPNVSGSYRINGNLRINNGNIAPNTRITIYVDGDVFISSNIIYTGAGSYGNDPTRIPQLKIVARGNIYVGADVDELNGIFIAQPDVGDTRGAFFTCGFDRGGGSFEGPSVSSGNGSQSTPYISSEYVNQCANQPLTVYGAVVARDVRLYRSQGTLPGGTEGYPSAAAERFIYTPDTWFNGDPSTSKPFQAYTALPSIF